MEKNKARGLESIKEMLLKDSKVSRLPFDYEDLIEECFKSDNMESSFLKGVFERHDDGCSSYLGYKDARLIEHTMGLFRAFKNCRIIHVYRDPRDVLASKKNADWSRNHSLWRNLASGRIQLNIAALTRESEFSDRFFEIKYESI